MLILISPAKTLKTDVSALTNSSIPEFIDNSDKLVARLKKLTPQKLGELMGISAKLAQINYERYQSWEVPFTSEDALNAIFAFRGEVYNGLDIDSFTQEDLDYTNNHLRILSGLYGLLKPMDAILPYRLEMGTKLKIGRNNNLYEYWGDKITLLINKQLKQSEEETIVNLASNEYFKVINTKKLKANIITPVFMEKKNGKYKVISIYAKKARGLMTAFILKNRIQSAEEIKHFDLDGYIFNDDLSKKSKIAFTRQ